MGALVVAILATLAGAGSGAAAASRAAQALTLNRRERLARAIVMILAGAAGAEVAGQLDHLVRELQANAELGPFVGGHAPQGLDAITVVFAFRGILFYGGLLVGLAAAVGLIAIRNRRTDG